jgi:ABC-three component (ABC-3C) system Middle Component 3
MPNRTSWDLPWQHRPAEEARNLNPAFCGELISRTALEYFRLRQQPFGFALSFVILPIVLHKPTRERLPGNASAAFAGWVADRGPILAELPDRALRLVPVTREALLFLIQHKAISLDAGGLSPGVKPISRSARPLQVTDDVADARSAASLLGRWFASQTSASSIMQGLGVSP